MDLPTAAAAGDIEGVERLLAEGADPNVADATYSEREAKRLRRRAYQNDEDTAFRSHKRARAPLSHTAAGDHGAVVSRLLEAGADPDAVDVMGCCAVAAALHAGHPAMARRLLEAGADPNIKDAYGQPLLSLALVKKQLDLARELLHRGAEANPSTKIEHKPLNSLLQVFPRAASPRLSALLGEDSEGHGPAPSLEIDASLDMVRDLLKAGADPRHPDALVAAIACDSPELYELLVGAGADRNQRGPRGKTQLDWAADLAATRLVDHFLARGVDPNMGPDSPLIYAVASRQLKIIHRLLGAGADPNFRQRDGKTILDIAVSLRQGEAAEVLRAAGARRGSELGPVSSRRSTNPKSANRRGQVEARQVEARQVKARQVEARQAEAPTDPREAGEEASRGSYDNADRSPVARRRGLFGKTLNSWMALLARGTASQVAEALSATGLQIVRSQPVSIDSECPAPHPGFLWLIRLEGHSWTLVLGETEVGDSLAERLSSQLGDRTLWIGYHDTASCYWYSYYDAGQLVEKFGSTGEGFSDRENLWGKEWGEGDHDVENLDLEFESTLRDPSSLDFRRYRNPDQWLDQFLREQDIYVPNCAAGRYAPKRLRRKGHKKPLRVPQEQFVLTVDCWPSHVLSPTSVAESILIELETEFQD